MNIQGVSAEEVAEAALNSMGAQSWADVDEAEFKAALAAARVRLEAKTPDERRLVKGPISWERWLAVTTVEGEIVANEIERTQ